MDTSNSKGKPILIVEGRFMYFTEGEVIELFDILVKSFKSVEMLVETIPPF
jgi:O-methyltransferase involved in polyketide biosynthesis